MRRSALVLGVALVGMTIAAWPPSIHVATRSQFALDPVIAITPGRARVGPVRVSVRDGQIAAVERSNHSIAPVRYVVPGLIDMHVHLPPRIVPGLVDLFQLLFLAHGVTTVREVGSIAGDSFEVSEQVRRGERAGPRVVSCGPILDGDPPAWPVARVVRNRAEGESRVRELATRGARCIKVYESLPVEALAGVQSAAAQLRLPLVGHPLSAFSLADTPVDDVQHLCYSRCGSVSPEEIEAFVTASARRGVAHTPTLVVFDGLRHLADGVPQDEMPHGLMPRFWREAFWRPIGPQVGADALPAMLALVRKLHESGVRIHAGTDPLQPFVVPGASLHRELALLVEAGLSREESMAAATSVAGGSLGIAGLGRIEVGAPADLLVLREDPTRDLAALMTIEEVVAGGRRYPIQELHAALEEQRRYLESAPVGLPLRGLASLAVAIAERSHGAALGQ